MCCPERKQKMKIFSTLSLSLLAHLIRNLGGLKNLPRLSLNHSLIFKGLSLSRHVGSLFRRNNTSLAAILNHIINTTLQCRVVVLLLLRRFSSFKVEIGI